MTTPSPIPCHSQQPVYGFPVPPTNTVGQPGNPILEVNVSSVTTPHSHSPASRLKLAPCRCRSWACRDFGCKNAFANKKRELLRRHLSGIKNPTHITLTVDPMLFSSPRDAYLYLKKRIGIFAQDLRRSGLLNDPRWAAVMEPQSQTLYPHFHLIVDAKLPPLLAMLNDPNLQWGGNVIKQLWGKHRPPTAPPVIGDRPTFGSLLISTPPHDTKPGQELDRLLNYVMKRIEVVPDWMLDMGGRNGRLALIKKSRMERGSKLAQGTGIKGTASVPRDVVAKVVPRVTTNRPSDSRKSPRLAPRKPQRTYRERIADCGKQSVVLRIRKRHESVGWSKDDYQYKASIDLGPAERTRLHDAGLIDDRGWVVDGIDTLKDLFETVHEVIQREVKVNGTWYRPNSF